MPAYTLTINGIQHTVDAEPDMPLLWVLRDLLQMTGTKFGCGVASCGACTVLADGQAVRSCVWQVQNAQNVKITTVEGLSEDGTHPVQKAWESVGVPQCGYCQAGQMMTLAGLLNKYKQPTEEQITNAMSAVLCRCGTYHRIRKAVQMAVEESANK
ncbi:MAG: (2Fe-2S)-binding protein [Lewinellaceae bacterium]|nr:(2Fe-2S)-binding protein [Lewinellaceae bacterium]